MKKILLVLLTLSNFSYAVEEYYSISKSIRSLGMGGAFYALSDDEYALFYNPAGLSNYRGKGSLMFGFGGEISLGATSAIQTVTNQSGGEIASVVDSLAEFQGKPIHAGFSLFPHYVTKNFAVGLLLADTKTNFAILGRDLDTTVDFTMIVDNGLIIGFGRQAFHEDLHVGFNLKGIMRAGGKKSFTVLEIASGSSLEVDPNTLGGVGGGIDMDLGAIYDVRGLPFGILNQVSLTISNLLASDLTMFKAPDATGRPPGLQRMVTLGARSVLPGVGPFDQFTALLDLQEFGLGGESEPEYGARSGNFFKHVNMGVEAPINGWLMLRAGIHQGYLTAGFGIQVLPVKIDFATYAEELSTGIDRLSNRRIALRIALGAGSWAPPPVPPKTSLSIKEEGSTEPAGDKLNNKVNPPPAQNEVPTEPKPETAPEPKAEQSSTESEASESRTPAEDRNETTTEESVQ